MTDNALEVAHNPDAPPDEREDAMRQAQESTSPSSVPDMLPLVQYVAEQYEQQQMMSKALQRPGAASHPSLAVQRGKPGMQSVFLDDQQITLQGQWYDRPGAFDFGSMRQMADRTPILSAVILTRTRQIRRFCRIQESGEGPGFAIKPRDPTITLGRKEKEEADLLQKFITNCGWESRPRHRMRLKRDNFSNLMAKLVRDSLTMDSTAIETEFKRDKSLGLDGLYGVDGATIRLCTDEGYEGDDEIFAVQVVDGNVRTAYTYDDLIYVPRNPRTDVISGGYGLSETELLIRVVTGFLNAMTHNLSYFDKNEIPKGLLHLSGDYSQKDISAFKRYWNAMTKGINNAWTLPVMVSKNQESKASFENFGVDVNEIMFAKWMTFLTSIICAIYGIAPDEINFESFTSGSTSALSGSDTEEKLINSKDKGLRPLLGYFEELFDDYVISEFGEKYVFRWTGLDDKPAETVWDEQKTLLTVNEARKARGWEETSEDWGSAPLNPVLQGAYQAAQQAAGEDYGTPDDGAPQEEGPEGQLGQEPEDADDGAPSGEEDEKAEQAPANQREEMSKALGLPVFRVDP